MGNLPAEKVNDIRQLLGIALDLVKLGLGGEGKTREVVALNGLYDVVIKSLQVLERG